ncbi:hypothetical protein CHCC20375_0715 [Bacillus licheniformis]|nr:hypothetical protein CHCC20375_0715 [Bacillus licheniformis]
MPHRLLQADFYNIEFCGGSSSGRESSSSSLASASLTSSTICLTSFSIR